MLDQKEKEAGIMKEVKGFSKVRLFVAYIMIALCVFFGDSWHGVYGVAFSSC